MSIYISKKVWKFLIKIQLTKSDFKNDRGWKVPCLMPIRVKIVQGQIQLSLDCLTTWLCNPNNLILIQNTSVSSQVSSVVCRRAMTKIPFLWKLCYGLCLNTLLLNWTKWLHLSWTSRHVEKLYKAKKIRR